jgi:hypothetical protein
MEARVSTDCQLKQCCETTGVVYADTVVEQQLGWILRLSADPRREQHQAMFVPTQNFFTFGN